jgi:hypothetical protein
MILMNPAMTADPAKFKPVTDFSGKPKLPPIIIFSRAKLTSSLLNRPRGEFLFVRRQDPRETAAI